MVFQEVLPLLLSPPSIAGAAFYILVYALIEKMVNSSTGAGKGKGDTGAGPEIRGEREGEDRNQFTEVDLTTEQLKERIFILIHAIVCSVIAIGVISETYHTDVQPRSSYFVTLNPFLFWYFVVSMFYWVAIFAHDTPSVSFSVIWRRGYIKRYMIYQCLAQHFVIMMLSSDRDAYLHMSIGCVILSQEFSSACLSVVIIEQLYYSRKTKPVSTELMPVHPRSAVKRRHLSARKQSSNKVSDQGRPACGWYIMFCKSRCLEKCWTYLYRYPISYLKYAMPCCSGVVSLFKYITSCCAHPYSRYIVFAGLALFSFYVRIVLIPMLYLRYGAHIGITKYELVKIIAPSEFVVVGIYVAIQIYWLVDACIIIVKYADMVGQIKRD